MMNFKEAMTFSDLASSYSSHESLKFPAAATTPITYQCLVHNTVTGDGLSISSRCSRKSARAKHIPLEKSGIVERLVPAQIRRRQYGFFSLVRLLLM